MFELAGWVLGSQLQSIYQLGTAIALAFIVAGPAVRTVLARQMVDFDRLRSTLLVLRKAGSANMQPRIDLCEAMRDILEQGDLDPIGVNPATNILYVAGATISFGLLVACSIFQTIPVAVAWIGIVVVACVMFVDPIRIAIVSPKLSRLVSMVSQIAKTQDTNDLKGTGVTEARIRLARLSTGSLSLDDAIAEIDAIRCSSVRK